MQRPRMNNRNRAASLQMMENAIVAGEMTITRQLVVIERLQRLNVSTKDAEDILREMEAVLSGYYAYRKQLLK